MTDPVGSDEGEGPPSFWRWALSLLQGRRRIVPKPLPLEVINPAAYNEMIISEARLKSGPPFYPIDVESAKRLILNPAVLCAWSDHNHGPRPAVWRSDPNIPPSCPSCLVEDPYE